ncbi:MAG: 30S ribosomal protein S13 [Nitrososphaerales archaeon]|nr:30S ribosomal protein S13 [Nitrososphaerales archaeon]
MSTPQEFRHLVRISGKDLDGSKKLVVALSDVKGVGDNFAASVVKKLGIDPRVRVGTLTEAQVHEVERALQNAATSALPQWYYNRRNDPETGETKQFLGSDLDFVIKGDMDKEKNVQSWRGIRHTLGLKVRGQRTRTTGRKGRTVGVRKAALQEAAKAAAAAAGKEEKK